MFERFTKLFDNLQSGASATNPHATLHKIEFDMMLKGTLYERSNGKVRQCAVTVNGATKLVTSGDIVDQQTYDALIEYGAIAPASKKKQENPPE